MSSKVSRFFVLPHASYGPLEFAPQAAAACVSKEWREKMRSLLERCWNALPDSLSECKAFVERNQPDANFFKRFQLLNQLLVKKLEKIHPTAPEVILERFEGSLAQQRILHLDSKLARLKTLFPGELVSQKLCFRAKSTIFEFAPDAALPLVSKSWRDRMNHCLEKWWWELPLSLEKKKKDLHASHTMRPQNYYVLFRTLNHLLQKKLASLDAKSANRLKAKFLCSLSPRRVVVLLETIQNSLCLKEVWAQLAKQVKIIPYFENVRAIRKAFLHLEYGPAFNQMAKLQLSGRQLTVLPRQISLFQGLNALDISCNHLSALPEFFYFSNLQVLYIGGNKFLPSKYFETARIIADMPSLSRVICDDRNLNLMLKEESALAHSLRVVWRQIMHAVPALQRVCNGYRASEIRRAMLDESNRKQFNLVTFLNLKKSELKVLAEEIFVALRNLRHLDLSHNPLTELPLQSMLELKELASLDLEYTALPAGSYQQLGNTLAKLPLLTTVMHDQVRIFFKLRESSGIRPVTPKEPPPDKKAPSNVSPKSTVCVVQ